MLTISGLAACFVRCATRYAVKCTLFMYLPSIIKSFIKNALLSYRDGPSSVLRSAAGREPWVVRLRCTLCFPAVWYDYGVHLHVYQLLVYWSSYLIGSCVVFYTFKGWNVFVVGAFGLRLRFMVVYFGHILRHSCQQSRYWLYSWNCVIGSHSIFCVLLF